MAELGHGVFYLNEEDSREERARGLLAPVGGGEGLVWWPWTYLTSGLMSSQATYLPKSGIHFKHL